MADAVVSFALEKLTHIVTEQVNIRKGVKDGVECLKEELGYLLAYVNAAETQRETDHIRLWIDDVKEVANLIVIVLERFSAQQEEHEAPVRGGVRDQMWSFFCICKKEDNLFDIGKKIESLKEKVVGLNKRRVECGINIATPIVKQRKRALLRAASFEHEVDVIGFEKDIRTLLDEHVRKGPFMEWEGWPSLLLLRYGQDSLNKMEEEALLRHLRKILEDGDHYLAVIDDIWDEKVWEKVQHAFPDKENGSRIIITTRNKTVAERVGDTCFVYKLGFLSKEDSWQLFCKRAKPTLHLETLGKEIVGKCGGLPLAIVILSGLLLQKQTYTFWSDVKDHLWKMLKGKSWEVQEILNLSYDELSVQMKKCFLYLARYPEDRDIEVFELKLLWIAEDFISKADEEGVNMEDVAEDCVNELISRNMIQIQVQSPEGQVFECRVHDLVRDLAKKKAREQKILEIFDSGKHPNPILLLQGQVRHAIYNGFGEYLKLLGPYSDSIMKLMYTRFKYLKVLDLTHIHVEVIPEEIGEEREEEEGYNFESIANLKNLGTLHLIMRFIISTIQPLWSCKHLEKVILSGKIKDPAELSFLPDSVTELKLTFTEFTKDPMPILGCLSNLTALYLDTCAYDGDKMVCRADAFPCLQYLKLEYLFNPEEFQVDDGALPCLKAFEIDGCYRMKMDMIPQRMMSLPRLPGGTCFRPRVGYS